MISLFRVTSLLLVLAAAALFVLPGARADRPKHHEVIQTFEPARNNGTPLVQVRFSNTVIGTFAIDTGEYESVITEGFAKRAGLEVISDGTSNFFGFLHYRFVHPPAIKLENLTITGPVFRQVPQEFLPEFSGRPIDGILGGDLLSRFALRIDYPAHEIGWITPGNLSDDDASALGFMPQNRIELGQERTSFDSGKVNHYSLRADFQNQDQTASEDLMIDTGSYDTLISRPLVEKLKLTSLKTQMIGTLSEPEALAGLYSAAKMQIGQTALAAVSVVAPLRSDSGFPSLLGENVLSDCVVLFDFGPHRFYLKPVLPPVLPDSTAPLDKKLIAWDRLRAAPDLPTVDEMLADGFATDAQDTLSEQAARLQSADPDRAKDPSKEIERLEKLGILRRLGEDEAGAKALFGQAVTVAKTAAATHPEDGKLAGQWVQALTEAGRDDEAIAAATQTTVRLPQYAPGWRLLGNILTAHVLTVLAGQTLTLTEKEALRLRQGVPSSLSTPAQNAPLQPLLAQAHAALDRAVTLAPTEADSYWDRGLFRLFSRIALTALQQAKVRVTLPAAEVPSEDAALALALADWQQCAALSPDNSKRLAALAVIDRQIPLFHDRPWLTAHLKGRGVVLPATLMTAETAPATLTRLTQSADKSVAAAAWTALGNAQADKGDAAATDCEASWRQALTLDPMQNEALTALALHLRQAGRWGELQALLTEQIKAHETVPARLALASVLNGAGLPADAEVQVRAARLLAPDNASVNLFLAELLLARSGSTAAALAEAATCLDKARVGYGTLATLGQQATLTTAQAVWLALDHDPDTAKKQLVDLSRAQPTCTQVREALAALMPY